MFFAASMDPEHSHWRAAPKFPDFSRAPCRTVRGRPAGTGGTAKIREFRLGALAGFVWDPLKWRKNMKSNLKLKAQAHSELPTAPVLLLNSSIKVLCSECTREAINGDVCVYSDKAERKGETATEKTTKPIASVRECAGDIDECVRGRHRAPEAAERVQRAARRTSGVVQRVRLYNISVAPLSSRGSRRSSRRYMKTARRVIDIVNFKRRTRGRPRTAAGGTRSQGSGVRGRGSFP